jgi:hypothetical protein
VDYHYTFSAPTPTMTISPTSSFATISPSNLPGYEDEQLVPYFDDTESAAAASVPQTPPVSPETELAVQVSTGVA